MPQRTYIVPLNVSSTSKRVTLMVENQPQTKLVLTGINPPDRQSGCAMRYIRLSSSQSAAASWAESGQIFYSNRYYLSAGERNYPYIFGGDCVRAPTEQTLASYHESGYLNDITLDQLQEYYRLEGIDWDNQAIAAGTLHVLEGGTSLACPLPGTAGFARLFGQGHVPYEPKSDEVEDAACKRRSKSAAPAGAKVQRRV